MKPLIVILIIVFNLAYGHTQILNVMEEFALPKIVEESSGILFFNKKLITHNDSKGKNELYELDLNTHNITRVVRIANANHVDWEDITQDNTHIYIGDFGNNNGNRNDLKIFKIKKSDYLKSNTVTAEVINFRYANQSNHTSNPQNTTWDAEALLSLNTTTLVLISKNWVNGKSNAYIIPKTPGSFNLKPLPSTLQSGGLITGATYNALTGKLFLVGYTSILQPFIWECVNFNGNDVFSGTNTQTMLTALQLEQIEAITFIDNKNYIITSESFRRHIAGIAISDYAKVVSFSTINTTLSQTEIPAKHEDVILYPNPVTDILNIKGTSIKTVQVYDVLMHNIISTKQSKLNFKGLNAGLYVIKVSFDNDNFMLRRVIKI